MRRELVLAVAAATAAAVATAGGALAQPAKAKPKVLKGGYDLTLPPDPTMEATGQVGMHCANVDPLSVDNHPLTLPGKGNIKIDLSSDDPTGNLDWDLYLLDAKGNVIGMSDSPTAQEEINAPAKGKVTIRACNLMGQPTASVKYLYKSKK